MPFHAHHQQPSSSPNPPGTASGIYQAAQALGSIGAPTGNLRVATGQITSAGTDTLLPGSGNAPSMHSSGGQTAPPVVSGLPGPLSSAPGQGQHYDAPRRAPTIGRTPEELHISSAADSMGHHGSSQPAPQGLQQQAQHQHQQSLYGSPEHYSTSAASSIGLQPAPLQNTHYSTSQSIGPTSVPGSLQPAGGASQRPVAPATYPAPSTVPTMPPQISTNAQQYTLPTRSNTMNTSHAYSRSSPAGLEQKYIPFSSTPDNKYASTTPSQRYQNPPQTPTGAASQSPLGLADIRPRANSNILDDAGAGGPVPQDHDRMATNSNYLAPWGVYAFDWCKWPVQGGNSAGKIALGSYLEDTHNFVSMLGKTRSKYVVLFSFSRSKYLTHRSRRRRRAVPPSRLMV